MSEDDNPDNLPSNIPPLPEVPCVGSNQSLGDIQAADAMRSEVILQRLYMELAQPMSITSLTRTANALFKGMEVRRHLLNRPYGAGNKGKDDGIIDPLD